MKARKLTARNHRQWIARLAEAARIDEKRGWETGQASYYELIGNVCWHFAPEEAVGWFRRALELRRKVGWEPNWMTATLLWKLGDEAGLREESRRIVAINEARLRELQAAAARALDIFRERERLGKVRSAFHELAFATLLSEDFGEAERWAQAALGDGQPGLYTHEAIRDMAAAIVQRDAGLFAQAIDLLRKRLEVWPSDAGNIQTELYRYGLTLATKHFPGLVTDTDSRQKASRVPS